MTGQHGFFTLTELTKRIGCDRLTARRNTIQRGCPHVPAGNETFFVTSEFVAWMKGKQITLTTEPADPKTGPAAFISDPPTDKRAKTLKGRR